MTVVVTEMPGMVQHPNAAVPVSCPWGVAAAATPTHTSADTMPQSATYFVM